MPRSGALLMFLLVSVVAATAAPLMITPSPDLERVRIAVLDFENREALDAASAGYLADIVRAEARRALPTDDTIVMTRDSILELLPPGTSLAECVGNCAVETGRRLGVDYVVTGEVIRFGGKLRVILSLYSTEEANLLVMKRVAAQDVLDLEERVSTAAEEVFATLPMARPALNQPSRRRVTIELITDPPGAVAQFDDSTFCRSTPCNLEVAPGIYHLSLDLDGHHPWTETLTVPADIDTMRLQRLLDLELGFLDIDTDPSGLSISVDDRPLGRTPLRQVGLRPGYYTARVIESGYRDIRKNFRLDGGETEDLLLVTEKLDVPEEEPAIDEDSGWNKVGLDGALILASNPRPDFPSYEPMRLGYSFNLGIRTSPRLTFGPHYGAIANGIHHKPDDTTTEQSTKLFLVHRAGAFIKYHLWGGPSIYTTGFVALAWGNLALDGSAIEGAPERPDIYLPATVAGGSVLYGWGFGWETGFHGLDDGGLSFFVEAMFTSTDMSLNLDDYLVWEEDGEYVYGPKITGKYEQFYRYTEFKIGVVFR